MKKIARDIGVAVLIVTLFSVFRVWASYQGDIYQLKETLLKEDDVIEKISLGYETEDMSIAFDNFVVEKVMEDLREGEIEKYKLYDNLFDPDFMTSLRTRQSDSLEVMTFEERKIFDYISITTFVDGETYDRFSTLMNDSTKDHLVIDLRGNTGGNFNDMKKMLDDFIEVNKLLYQIRERNNVTEKYSQHDPIYDYEHIFILVDGKTASVSELFVASMKENLDHVILIGEKTYGKSIMASSYAFNDDSAMMVISGLMVSPDGSVLSDKGIPVDYEAMNEECYDTVNILLKNTN